MDNAYGVKDLVQREPWRAGQGHVTALDPTWPGYEPPICKGNIIWEKGSKWWWCEKCGHCSFWSTTTHQPARHPLSTFMRNVVFFFQKKAEQGLSGEQALQQLLHAAGMVVKVMAEQPPEGLANFIEKIREAQV
jgi:hypothetical protein